MVIEDDYIPIPPFGVTSIDGLFGNITFVAGTNMTIVPSGSTITFSSSGGGGSSNSFSTIQPDSGTSPVADSPTDTLTLTSANQSVIINGDSTSDTIDFSTQISIGVTPIINGANQQILFNSSDFVSGSSVLAFDGSELVISGGSNGLYAEGHVTALGDITTSGHFLGSGELLTDTPSQIGTIVRGGNPDGSFLYVDGGQNLAQDGSFYTDGAGHLTANSFTGDGAGLTNVSISSGSAILGGTNYAPLQVNGVGNLDASTFKFYSPNGTNFFDFSTDYITRIGDISQTHNLTLWTLDDTTQTTTYQTNTAFDIINPATNNFFHVNVSNNNISLGDSASAVNGEYVSFQGDGFFTLHNAAFSGSGAGLTNLPETPGYQALTSGGQYFHDDTAGGVLFYSGGDVAGINSSGQILGDGSQLTGVPETAGYQALSSGQYFHDDGSGGTNYFNGVSDVINFSASGVISGDGGGLTGLQIPIGTSIPSSTVNSVLYVDASNELATDGSNPFTYDGSGTLTVGFAHVGGVRVDSDIIFNSNGQYLIDFGGGGIALDDNSGNPLWSVDPSGNLIATGNITATVAHAIHFVAIAGAIGIAAGAGAGTAPTVSIVGSESSGEITILTGTLPSAASTVATITFSDTWASAPYVVFSPSNTASALLSGATMVYVPLASTTAFTLKSGSTGLVGATTYKWQYNTLG